VVVKAARSVDLAGWAFAGAMRAGVGCGVGSGGGGSRVGGAMGTGGPMRVLKPRPRRGVFRAGVRGSAAFAGIPGVPGVPGIPGVFGMVFWSPVLEGGRGAVQKGPIPWVARSAAAVLGSSIGAQVESVARSRPLATHGTGRGRWRGDRKVGQGCSTWNVGLGAMGSGPKDGKRSIFRHVPRGTWG
jgi:hypothetical protein